MSHIHLSKNDKALKGHITLAGSKSISNRVLMIRALSGQNFNISKLANAQDTQTLDALLQEECLDDRCYDVGAAGTSFRFLTAYLSLQKGSQVLTGSARMKERPIGILVDALRQLGARIDYLEQEGYPPLAIHECASLGADNNNITIAADTSSQYISALLMIAPSLPQGLKLTLDGEIVSRPYIEMTLRLMAHFGINYQWEGQSILIAAQTYVPQDFVVEADWSAASYYYSMAALSDDCALQLDGLFQESLQGDAVLQDIYTQFGIQTQFNTTGLLLTKDAAASAPSVFEYDFLECPDIAQTLAVSCAALGVQGLFSGLETLRIKETDRISALQTELAKVNSHLMAIPSKFSKKSTKNYYLIEGKAQWDSAPTFDTYEDHRMAMAFAPLALLAPIQIADQAVVAKSYPDFWRDIGQFLVVSE